MAQELHATLICQEATGPALGESHRGCITLAPVPVGASTAAWARAIFLGELFLLMPMSVTDPICPVCASRVTPGNVVVYDHSELTHIDCHSVLARDLTDKVIAALLCHPGQNFCYACLAQELNVSHAALKKAVGRLRTNAEVGVFLGDCSRCCRPRITVRARVFGRGRTRFD